MNSHALIRPAIFLAILSCGEAKNGQDDTGQPSNSSEGEGEGEGEGETDCADNEDPDGDGLDDCAEAELGTDPNNADSDGDGLTDGEETDCGSDPNDIDETCPECSWPQNDPGDLVSTGNTAGDVIANLTFVDQCEEELSLWDLTGEYHILWMTAVW